MLADFSDVHFWAINMKKAQTIIKKNEDVFTKGMSDLERKAYLLGVENAFSILDQLFKSGVNNQSIQFYNPDADIGDEYSDEELLAWVNKQKPWDY
ncbi:MAG: hypothetical protein ACLRPZ_05875 [Coprococcus sp.]